MPPIYHRPIARTGLIVDSFAGGGGASTGIHIALGRAPDVAINHDAEAIALHAANHPETRHFCESVWTVSPHDVADVGGVDLLWASPDCKHFSKAKGGKPVSKGVRGLAWVVVGWARKVKPKVIILENVEEFQTWGPLDDDGMPDPKRKGLTFKRWVGYLRGAGYVVEWRELRACDYGAPTSRKRLFVIARSDGKPVVWPTPTHSDPAAPRDLFSSSTKPWRTAAECIDWSIPCPSIFDRKKPLADKTLARIARGLQRFVLENPRPFIVPITHSGPPRAHSIDEPMRTITTAHRGEFAFIAPTLIQTGYGEREGQAPRSLDLHAPHGTVVAGGCKTALVAAFLSKFYGTSTGSDLSAPMPTATSSGQHLAEVRAFLVKYFGNERGGVSCNDPMDTVTTRDRFGLVVVDGVDHVIVDIGMRMLTPRELARAQGFPDSYLLDLEGLSKTAQVRMIGNSVCPPIAAALVAANVTRPDTDRVAA